MAYNHALRGKTPDLHAEYEPNDGNLAASGGSMLLSFWVRKSASGVPACPVYIEGNNSFFLYCYRSGSDWVLTGPGAATATWTGAVAEVGDGEWHHIIIEADYSGGAGNGTIRVWADGDVKAQNTGLTWSAPTVFSEFHVGGDKSVPGVAQLDIDDLAIFEGYSTEAERDAAYNAGSGVKGLDDDDFANATRTFYASYDQNSATADAADGTPAPIAGRYAFIDGFWFGQATGFETTTLGPDELHWCTNGEILYDPDRGESNGYEHWSARLGTYSDQVGRFRVAADSGDLQLWCESLNPTFPHYFHIRFQTDGLQAGESVILKLTAPDSRGDGAARTWACTIFSDHIQGKNANNVVTVNTEAWVDLKVQAWIEQTTTYAVHAHAVINDEHELQIAAGDNDLSPEMLGLPSIRFFGSGLTGSPYVEIASLAIHSHMQPEIKKSAADTFPDEDHLVATSNAGRQSYDVAIEHPFTDKGTIWTQQTGTWADNTLGMPSAILDTAADRLLIWIGARHNEPDWYTEPGMYRYNIGFGDLDLTNWPDITIADGVGVTQGGVVYRPNTPFLYPHHPGVIDCHDGRRMMVCVRYHLPDSPSYVGQCRGDVVLGELTDNETFVVANGGRPLVVPRPPPSYADAQFNTNTPVYIPDGMRSLRYVFWGQCYGDRNTWGGGGSAQALRGLYMMAGETMETMSVWPTGSAVLPIWDPPHTFHMLVRAADDFAGLSVAGGATKWFFLMRGRSPVLLHPPEQFGTFYAATSVQSAMLVEDAGRGVSHLIMDDSGIHYAYMRTDGFDWIGIDSGQTTGDVTTVTIQKPSSGWGSLYVNVDADEPGGKIEVAVIDPATGDEIAGYGQADCTDMTVDSTDAEVTWGSSKLSSLTDATLRLRFHLTRADSGDPTPRLYSYRVADWPSAGVTQATKTVCAQDLLL